VAKETLLGPALTEEEEYLGQTWLNSQPAQHYTIQLAASLETRLIDDYIKQLALTDNFAHIVSLRDGHEWHGIVYGSYASMSEAREAMKALPGHWQSWQPWPRAFGTIKSHPHSQTFHIQ
jgi:DamX protein